MAYSELIKSCESIRDYMRQFYVYGFKTRSEYDAKSARSYDNERRRVESWLGEYMTFRQNSGGKQVFLSVDSRAIEHNPLYNVFKAKSFTDKDITLHFCILDILADGLDHSVRQIVDSIGLDYLAKVDSAVVMDESTVRKKLKEYEELGLLQSEKQGKERVYRRTADAVDLNSWQTALQFFSEIAPLGVVGSTLLDKLPRLGSIFRFKHHYILHAIDSAVMCDLLTAIGDMLSVELKTKSVRRPGIEAVHTVFPVKLYLSTQTGRQYLLCWVYRFKAFRFFRLDLIKSVKSGLVEPHAESILSRSQKLQDHLWGVVAEKGDDLEHVEMIIQIRPGEEYVLRRLEREKRCGTVEILDPYTSRFTADVYSAVEMIPWLRTFIGRIKHLECSNPRVVETFYSDIDQMTRMYGGQDHAVS